MLHHTFQKMSPPKINIEGWEVWITTYFNYSLTIKEYKTQRAAALTAVQVVLLTIYDMCKVVERGMVMGDVKLLKKSGGKSGAWVAEE